MMTGTHTTHKHSMKLDSHRRTGLSSRAKGSLARLQNLLLGHSHRSCRPDIPDTIVAKDCIHLKRRQCSKLGERTWHFYGHLAHHIISLHGTRRKPKEQHNIITQHYNPTTQNPAEKHTRHTQVVTVSSDGRLCETSLADMTCSWPRTLDCIFRWTSVRHFYELPSSGLLMVRNAL